MTLPIMPNGFLGSDEGVNFQAPYAKAKTVIIPFGFEATVSYGGGTKKAPQAIIAASHQVELLDEQTLTEPYKSGVATLTESRLPKNPKQSLALLTKITRQVLADGKFPIVLGGEHSITQGILKAIAEKYKDVTVLQFDAHPDMHEHYHGSVFSHASVMYQALKNLPIKSIVQVGIRNLSKSNGEWEFRQKNHSRIKTFWGWENPSPGAIVKAIKTKRVFITFDIDAFDPSIMPSTGTPEPGGLQWWPTLAILRAVFKSRQVVGCDVVELTPIKNLHAPDFLAARLVYKLISYKFNKY